MTHRFPSAFAVLVGVVVTLMLAACGSSSSSSGDARSLLQETFSGHHSVGSGVVSFALTVDPSGSSTLTGPITLSLGGPFQSLGAGKLPESNFSIGLTAQGRSSRLAVISTGTAGYVTLQGTSFVLPAATFQKLESSFSSVAASPSGGQSSLSRLGIHPLGWLQSPTVVGTETVGGAPTTHIHASLNVAAVLSDINTLLQKASSLGASKSGLPGGISAATQQRIAQEVHGATVDVWTGTSDKILRRLTLTLTLPVTGQIQTLLGGLSSARLNLTLGYSNVNQPQTITAPANPQPYSAFAGKLRSFLSGLQGGLGAGGTAGATSPGATSTGSASTGTSSTTGSGTPLQRYTACIQQAKGDIAKMQRCASIVGG